MGAMNEIKTSTPEIDKLIKLFTGANSAQLHDRHCASIERLCSSSLDGFAIQDLPKIQQILELTLGLLESGIDSFLEPACKLLRAMSKPFMKKSATDEFKLLGHVESILTAVGRAFTDGFSGMLQLAAAELLRTFATAHGPRPNALELANASGDVADSGSALRQYFTNQKLISQSNVAEAVIRGLAAAIVLADEHLTVSLTFTLLSFSYLPHNCKQLVNIGLLACMPHLLSRGYKHQVTTVAVELLWNLLENCPMEAKSKISASEVSLEQLSGIPISPPAEAPASPSRSQSTPATPQTNGDPAETEQESEPEASRACSNDGDIPAASLPAVPESVTSPEPQEVPLDSALAAALASLFMSVLEQGFREADKELRNNILVVINLVLESSQPFAAACHSAGLFEAVAAVSCAPECCSGAPYVKPWALSTDEIDLELKLLCWNTTATGCLLERGVVNAAKGAGLMPLLMQYLDIASPPPAVQRWNADRCSNLRAAALSVLHRVVPVCSDQYLAAGGIPIMMALMAHSSSPRHVEAALRHLHVLCNAVPGIAEVLGASGATGVLLELVQGRPNWSEGLRQAVLLLLTVMCTVNTENQRRFRKAQGVGVLLSQLARVCTMDSTLPSPFALAVLNAVWSCIVPDRKNVARFLVSDGMDMLLSLMERGHRAHRPLVLSIMADLMENPRALPFFHEWRSDVNQQAAAHLLISFWKEEDSLRGMTVDGMLANTAQPLKGLDRRTCWIPQEAVMYGNIVPERRAQLVAITEACTGEQVLGKIYSVLKLVGMGNLPYLSLEDQAMLCLIEKYVKFRQGEFWRQTKLEFENEGMRPTAADRVRLTSGIELSEHLAHAVREAQRLVLDRHMGTVKLQEAKFFEGMRAQKKLEQDMRFYQKDKSQLTVSELREAKKKKEQMLKNSHVLSKKVESDLNDSMLSNSP